MAVMLFLKGLRTIMMMLKNHLSVTLAVWNSSYFLNCLLWVSPVFYCYVWSRYFYFCEEQTKVKDSDATTHCASAMWEIFDPPQCIPVRDTIHSEILKTWAREGENSDLHLKGKQHLLSFPLLHVFHMCLWIIENPCTLKLFSLFNSLYCVYTSTGNFWGNPVFQNKPVF